MWKNLTRLENIPFEGGCLKTRQSWNRQVNRPPCHNKANIIFSTWISYFLWYFFNVLDVSYYVNNNESDYISVLAKINGDKVLGALKRVSQGYLGHPEVRYLFPMCISGVYQLLLSSSKWQLHICMLTNYVSNYLSIFFFQILTKKQAQRRAAAESWMSRKYVLI